MSDSTAPGRTGGPDAADPAATGRRSPVLLTVRPRRIAIYAAAGGVLVVAVMVFVAIRLRGADTGVYFRVSDALAMVCLGLLFAGGLMLLARPRLRVTASGVWVRNILGERYVEWPLVQRVAFPEGAVWANLELADDEVIPVMAIQSMDRGRAVEALRAARELHARYAPPAPPNLQPKRELKVHDPNRPLGRLEKIDLEKAAQSPRPRRGRRSR